MQRNSVTETNVRLDDTAPLPTVHANKVSANNVGVSIGAVTDPGKKRPNNEDQYFVSRLVKSVELIETSLPESEAPQHDNLEGYMMVVADGMGGHAGGERASSLVVQKVRNYVLHAAKWFFRLDDPDEEIRLQVLREGLEEIDRQIVEAGQRDPTLRGMGTTLTAAATYADNLFVVHVGDSRAYLFRDGVLDQLTNDHTLAQKLVEAGALEPEEAKTSRARHVLTNNLGSHEGVEVEIIKERLQHSDRLLLCSDGLTDELSDERITELLAQEPDTEGVCQLLLQEALKGKAKDNITLVVADYVIRV